MNNTSLRDDLFVDQVRIVRMENEHLRVDVAPEIGGRIISIFNRKIAHEFLWKNENMQLKRSAPGEPYDPNFYGGIDEIIPGDFPETIGQLENPDHGELWTLPLNYQIVEEELLLQSVLPLWGLRYTKRMSLRPGLPWIDMAYKIENIFGERRFFLWKLHAALAIEPGDQIVSSARQAVAADLEWSRWKTSTPFAWPVVEGQRADVIPPLDGTTDFLFLYDIQDGRLSCRGTARGSEFAISFDPHVFPYICYFASYGGLDQHYTAVLEPGTAMPVSVNEAARLKQCSVLEPGERLTTQVSIYAGRAVSL